MDADVHDGRTAELNARTRDAWNRKAAFWDDAMGDGNAFQRELILPAVERLLGSCEGTRVLDVGCGNGVVSRHLARRGAQVVGTDFSEALLERARARDGSGPPVEYVLADATREDEMRALGEGTFDAATCVMALQDMADVAPLFRALAALLTAEGRFVFAVPHPAFNIPQASALLLEEVDVAGTLTEVRSVKVTGYLRVEPRASAGMPNEPTPHVFFHRSLAELLNPAFAAGFVLDALEEPTFSATQRSPRALSWRNFSQIPPVMLVRLRHGGPRHGSQFTLSDVSPM